MLSHLDVHNYTLVDSLDLEFQPGLTTLTGETGAGKSLLLDAIGLAIGNKARGEAIHDAAANAEVSALFDLSAQSHIKKWLEEHDISINGNECLLKRIITPQGRSRCSINGHSATLSQLQELGRKLVNIHGQHEHQALLSPNTQRRLLDTFGNYPHLTGATDKAFKHWRQAEQALTLAQELADSQGAQYQLLKYQVDELTLLELHADEVKTLEAQQKRLSNAEELQETCASIVHSGRDSEQSIQTQLHCCTTQLQSLIKHDASFNDACEMLKTALINVQEAIENIDVTAQSYNEEECNLATIEERLSTIYTVARKHKVQPSALYEHQQALIEELGSLECSDEHIAALTKEASRAVQAYTDNADKLHSDRIKAAKRLCKAINQRLKALNMEHASFYIDFEAHNAPSQYGNHSVKFLISTIPGKPAGSLQKVASGGELSRISLAIQVVTAAIQTTPTLIFDEVDAGIGGTTGDTVGSLLRELGSKVQVLCVTHLAQVASKAHNHLNVKKTKQRDTIRSEITALSGDDIIAEISRMVGGPIDSNEALAHARQMMATH